MTSVSKETLLGQKPTKKKSGLSLSTLTGKK